MSKVLPIKVNKGTGDPVVLLHGLGNNHKSWTYVLEKLDYSRNTIIALDLLGFGEADKPIDSEYTASDHADAVIRTLESKGVTKAIIAGHSMGCIVAAEVARKRPDMVVKLVLLGAPIFRRLPSRFDRFKFWKKDDVYSKIFRVISKQKDMTLTAAKGLVKFVPLIKGMEITEETWPSFKKSLCNTIIQTKTYNDLISLTTPTELIYAHLDLFVNKKNLKRVAKKNKKYIHYGTMIGPHEITPLHGESIAKLIQEK